MKPVLVPTVVAFALAAAACGGASTATPTAEITVPTTADTETPTTTSAVASEMAVPQVPTGPDRDGDGILQPLFGGGITVGEAQPVLFEETGPDFEGEFGLGPALIAFATDGRVVALPVDLEAQGPTGLVFIFEADGNPVEVTEVDVAESEDGFFGATGTLLQDDQPVPFALSLSFGSGTSGFELNGNEAIVRGDLGAGTFAQMEYLIAEHPEVDTLVLQEISGSVNDEVNVETGRLVREAGLTTLVRSDGEIASGGVDLFAAGVVRIAEEGAQLGIHSWCCGPNGESADELDQTDPAHDTQIKYFTEMLGPIDGPAFYFRTLAASSFDGIDNMEASEMDLFNLVTGNNVLSNEAELTSDVMTATSDQKVDTPNDLASTVAEAWAEKTDQKFEVLLVLEGEPSKAYISFIEAKDDASTGELMTLTMEPDDAAGWAVVQAQSASVCSRGLNDGRCV